MVFVFFLKRKVIEFKNLIDKKFKYKIFIQPHMKHDKRFSSGEYSQYCEVYTDPLGSKGMTFKYNGFFTIIGWHALILYLKDGSINSNQFHASHLCNLPGRKGVCLTKSHLKLESSQINENRKQCLIRHKENPFNQWICDCFPKCLGSDR